MLLDTARKERLFLSFGIAVLVILSWAYLVSMDMDMHMGMHMDGMPSPMSWGLSEFLMLLVMWAVMMVAMMLPSALPMILAFLTVNQKRRGTSRRVIPPYIFIAGYLAIWTAYSVAAAGLQWLLHERALISSAMTIHDSYLAGGILIASGLFQFTPLKNACLDNCRSPLSFLLSEWREGYWGAFIMGLRHGGYCVGCCWALMLLLFVSGVMNIFAVAVIAAFVLVEKLVARATPFVYTSGLLLFLTGTMTILWHK